MAVADCEVVTVSDGAFDPDGNPFVTLVYYGADQAAFDEAIDLEDAKKVYLRSLFSSKDALRIRFTAYDKDGNQITNSVCESLRRALKHEGYAAGR